MKLPLTKHQREQYTNALICLGATFGLVLTVDHVVKTAGHLSLYSAVWNAVNLAVCIGFICYAAPVLSRPAALAGG